MTAPASLTSTPAAARPRFSTFGRRPVAAMTKSVSSGSLSDLGDAERRGLQKAAHDAVDKAEIDLQNLRRLPVS